MRQTAKTFTPNWHFETLSGGKMVAGVDEAGRGPLAGPVVAAAVILEPNHIPDGLNDSKKLSPAKRQALYDMLVNTAQIGIGMAEPEEIDRINILAATMKAMQRAVADLAFAPDAILIDGNHGPKFANPAQISVQTIVKGDAKSLSIAAASIIAKTTRDKLMDVADRRFPGYGFAGHKGYPTKAHQQALIKLGASPIHRRSYKPVKAVL